MMDLERMNQATLEINAAHPVVARLRAMVDSAPKAAETKAYATLLYEVAAITSGYSIADPTQFAARVTALMNSGPMPEPEKPAQVDAEVV